MDNYVGGSPETHMAWLRKERAKLIQRVSAMQKVVDVAVEYIDSRGYRYDQLKSVVDAYKEEGL